MRSYEDWTDWVEQRKQSMTELEYLEDVLAGVWEDFLLGEETRLEREEGADSDTAFLMACLRFYPERIGGALWVLERFGSPQPRLG